MDATLIRLPLRSSAAAEASSFCKVKPLKCMHPFSQQTAVESRSSPGASPALIWAAV